MTDYEIELQLEIAPAERDVGIMGDYIDNWSVIAVNGNPNTELCLEIEQQILTEYDDDLFIQKLYNEGAAD